MSSKPPDAPKPEAPKVTPAPAKAPANATPATAEDIRRDLERAGVLPTPAPARVRCTECGVSIGAEESMAEHKAAHPGAE